MNGVCSKIWLEKRYDGGDEHGMLRQAQHNAYPPAFPSFAFAQDDGEGGGRVIGFTAFQVNVSLKEGFGFSPLGDTVPEA
jgi:hypothetical protein